VAAGLRAAPEGVHPRVNPHRAIPQGVSEVIPEGVAVIRLDELKLLLPLARATRLHISVEVWLHNPAGSAETPSGIPSQTSGGAPCTYAHTPSSGASISGPSGSMAGPSGSIAGPSGSISGTEGAARGPEPALDPFTAAIHSQPFGSISGPEGAARRPEPALDPFTADSPRCVCSAISSRVAAPKSLATPIRLCESLELKMPKIDAAQASDAIVHFNLLGSRCAILLHICTYRHIYIYAYMHI